MIAGYCSICSVPINEGYDCWIYSDKKGNVKVKCWACHKKDDLFVKSKNGNKNYPHRFACKNCNGFLDVRVPFSTTYQEYFNQLCDKGKCLVCPECGCHL